MIKLHRCCLNFLVECFHAHEIIHLIEAVVKHKLDVFEPLWIFILAKGAVINELPRGKTNKMAYVPSEDSDQPGHPPSLIRVFAVRSTGSYVTQLP